MEVQHIIEAALEKCISIYDEAEKVAGQAAGSGSDYGKFPGAILIKYGEGSMRKAGYLMTEIWKMWYYTKGSLSEMNEMREQIREPVSGMFFPEAEAEFAIDEKQQYVYLSYYFGPRFGRGFRYTVKEQENVVTLCEEKILWIS